MGGVGEADEHGIIGSDVSFVGIVVAGREDADPALVHEARVASSAGAFLDGLLGPERRETGWMRAEAAGDRGPWRQQAILGRGRWEADALRHRARLCPGNAGRP